LLWKGKSKGKVPTAAIQVNASPIGINKTISYRLSFTRVGSQLKIVDERIENDRPDEGFDKPYLYFDLNGGLSDAIASGSRTDAFRDFCSGLRQHPGEYSVLLVDSETAVTATPWLHLNTREGDNWRRPSGAGVDQAHLMVQVMESWFLADRQTLFAYYGQRFLRNSLPRQQNIEKIDKEKVLETLRHASRHTPKGIYHKTRHGFELLELIDPSLVRAASRHANNLFAVLERETLR
jgi:hypothetical protein